MNRLPAVLASEFSMDSRGPSTSIALIGRTSSASIWRTSPLELTSPPPIGWTFPPPIGLTSPPPIELTSPPLIGCSPSTSLSPTMPPHSPQDPLHPQSISVQS